MSIISLPQVSATLEWTDPYCRGLFPSSDLEMKAQEKKGDKMVQIQKNSKYSARLFLKMDTFIADMAYDDMNLLEM